mgnify:CR=1 FL=1
MSRPRGEATLRAVLTAAVTAAALLALLISAELLARHGVMERLRRHDPRARVEEIRLGPGCVILEGISLPGRGAELEEVAVLLEGSLLAPRPSMVSVRGGIADLRRLTQGGGGGSGEAAYVPDVAFSHILLHDGADSSVCEGVVWSGGSRAVARMEGSWGSALLGLRRGPRADSLSLLTVGLSRIPHFGGGLPLRLQGRRYDARLSGTAGDSGISLSGRVTAIDGEPVDMPVLLCDSGRGISATLTLRLDSFGPWMEKRTAAAGLAYVSLHPAGLATVRVREGFPVVFACSMAVEPLRLYDPELCADTLGMDVHVVCRGSWSPETGMLTVRAGSLAVGEAGLLFDLDYRPRAGPRLWLRAWSDSLGGRELASSVPDPLLGRLRGLSLGGSAAFSLECVLDWDTPDSCDFRADVDVSRLRVDYSPVHFGRLRDTGAVCVMEDSWGNARTIALDTAANPGFLTLEELPRAWEPLLLCAEDATFRSHRGFCLYHIRNSIIADVESGSFRRGGSTITMQLAKNLFLEREKVLSRKLQEIFLAWRMERYLSKDRMLELYANIVEMGPNVFGVGEAALYYFDAPAESLSVLQTAFLVSILPGPGLYHRFFVGGKVPGYWRAYLERLVAIAQRKGWLAQGTLAQVGRDTLAFRAAVWEGPPGRGARESAGTRNRYETRLERSLYGASENVDSP